MPGAIQPDVIGAEHFPKVFAWIERFRQVVENRKAKLRDGLIKTLTGEEAASGILGAPFWEEQAGDTVDHKDPVAAAEGLKKGMRVRLWPTDTGSLHKDMGNLVAFNKRETVIETRGEDGGVLVRLHAPRHGFRVRRAEDGESRL